MDLAEVPAGGVLRRHPWEEARLAFFLRALRAHGLPRGASRVLDVGAGDAWFASRLAEDSGAEVVCWDAAYGEEPPAPRARLSFTAAPPRGTFGLVLALDVAEHVEDDRAFFETVVRDHLAPGGHLLFSVPAWPSLFSRHDVRLRHLRRYAPGEARRLLREVGLEVVRAGGLFHSLLVPRAVQKAVERLGASPRAHAGEWRAPGWQTGAAAALLGADARLSEVFSTIGWDVPGLSWWALCRRP